MENVEIEKLEEEIRDLKNRIKNTEYDLTNTFRGNVLLENKLGNSKKSLSEKLTLLAQIKSNPITSEALQQTETKIEENMELSIDQKQIIESEVEKQFE